MQCLALRDSRFMMLIFIEKLSLPFSVKVQVKESLDMNKVKVCAKEVFDQAVMVLLASKESGGI